MRRTLSLAYFLIAIASATPASAQGTTPAVEVFGGYSVLPANGDDFPRQTSHGFQAGLAANLNTWFGVATELGWQRNTARDLGPNFPGLVAKTQVREYLVGPRFTARAQGVSVFGHAWVGSATGDAGEDFSGFSDSGLTLGGGGGVDVEITPKVAVRLQYRPSRQFRGHRRRQPAFRRRRRVETGTEIDDRRRERGQLRSQYGPVYVVRGWWPNHCV